MEKWLWKQCKCLVSFMAGFKKKKKKSNSLLSPTHTVFGKCGTIFIWNVFWSSCQLVLGTYRNFWDPYAYKTMTIAPWMLSLPGATSTEILEYLLKFVPAILVKWTIPWNKVIKVGLSFLKRTMQWSHLRFLLPILVWWCHWKLLKSKKLKVREKIVKHQIPYLLVGV